MSAPKAALRSEAEPWQRRLYLPAYKASDVAKYARTNVKTVAYWHYMGGGLGPALPGKERRKPLSYLQLIEVAVVATFRNLGVSLQRIRKAREYARQVLEAEFPFAEFRFKTEGYHMLMDLQQVEPDAELEHLIMADEHGKMAWQLLVSDRFAEFDYTRDGLAVTWHLAGRQSPVLIDPRISFGAPNVRGIPTWAVRGRRIAGESIKEIQEDFGLKGNDVLEALAFEGLPLAA